MFFLSMLSVFAFLAIESLLSIYIYDQIGMSMSILVFALGTVAGVVMLMLKYPVYRSRKDKVDNLIKQLYLDQVASNDVSNEIELHPETKVMFLYVACVFFIVFPGVISDILGMYLLQFVREQ